MKTLALIPLVVLALASAGCASPGLERARCPSTASCNRCRRAPRTSTSIPAAISPSIAG